MNRHAIIVPVSIRTACNQVAHTIGIDPEGSLNTLSVPLVAKNSVTPEVATHYAACGCMTEEQRLYLESESMAGAFPGAFWWRFWSDESQADVLVSSYDGKYLGQPWGWNESLEAVGLKPRVSVP